MQKCKRNEKCKFETGGENASVLHTGALFPGFQDPLDRHCCNEYRRIPETCLALQMAGKNGDQQQYSGMFTDASVNPFGCRNQQCADYDGYNRIGQHIGAVIQHRI